MENIVIIPLMYITELPREPEIALPTKDIINALSSINTERQKGPPSPMSINRGMDKENIVLPCNGKSFSLRKK